jgi:hypothetical protein
MSGKKIAKALIGGNWKCNGTVSSVKAMAEVLNKAGPFSANSEVCAALRSYYRPSTDWSCCYHLGCYCCAFDSLARLEVHSST